MARQTSQLTNGVLPEGLKYGENGEGGSEGTAPSLLNDGPAEGRADSKVEGLTAGGAAGVGPLEVPTAPVVLARRWPLIVLAMDSRSVDTSSEMCDSARSSTSVKESGRQENRKRSSVGQQRCSSKSTGGYPGKTGNASKTSDSTSA